MSSRKLLILIVGVFCVISVVIYYMNYGNLPQNEGNQPLSDPNTPEGSVFVIPESPLGTLGLISALAAALGLFALGKKKQNL